MEFVNFKAIEENRIAKLKRDVSTCFLAVRQILNDGHRGLEFETLRNFSAMLVNQFERLEEIESVPFDDRPALLVEIEQRSCITVLQELLNQLFICRDAILNSVQN